MHNYCNEFVNAWLEGKEVEIPEFLYKYRPFDEHSFDMLENEYLYLCKARRLDDPSECKATVTLENYYDIKTKRLSRLVVDHIIEPLRTYCSDADFGKIKDLVYLTMTPDGRICRNRLLEIQFDIKRLAPNADVVKYVNLLGSIPEKMQELGMRRTVEKLLFLAYDAREEMGICSLSEHSNSPEMWEDYADGSSGYCIEYHTKGYERSEDIFPVSYTDRRNTDIVFAILAAMIGKLVQELSNGEMVTDKSQYFCLFLTKNTKWQHQKEWRIIGNAGEKAKAPPIKTIYVGRNAKPENAERIKKFCLERGIGFTQR